MASLLQKQFCSVFSSPGSPHKRDRDFKQTTSGLDDIEFSVEDIASAISQMKIDSAPGEDEIPTILLKNCCSTISYPLLSYGMPPLNQV